MVLKARASQSTARLFRQMRVVSTGPRLRLQRAEADRRVRFLPRRDQPTEAPSLLTNNMSDGNRVRYKRVDCIEIFLRCP